MHIILRIQILHFVCCNCYHISNKLSDSARSSPRQNCIISYDFSHTCKHLYWPTGKSLKAWNYIHDAYYIKTIKKLIDNWATDFLNCRQSHLLQISFQLCQSISLHVCFLSGLLSLNLLTYYKDGEVLNKDGIVRKWSNCRQKRKQWRLLKKNFLTTKQVTQMKLRWNSIYSSVVNFN